MPCSRPTRIAVGLLVAFAAAYVLVPAVAGLDETWGRLAGGDPWWLSAALGFEVLSFLAYVALFRAVFSPAASGIDWRQSYRITMAGLAATRVLAAAGAGGVALTAWALRREGVAKRRIATRIATFLVLLYSVFMAALLLGGVGLWAGVLPGPAPVGLTIVPAAFGALVIAVALAVAAVAPDVDAAVDRLREADGGRRRWTRALELAPAGLGAGVRGAIALLRSRNPALAGAPAWWGFDIAVLWACLEAFGGAPPVPVVVMAYFIGMVANTLPVPGGIGVVDGGMIGALAGFGVDAGLAIVAVLAYRGFAFWLPTVPGVVAYLQLLRAPGTAVSPAPGR